VWQEPAPLAHRRHAQVFAGRRAAARWVLKNGFFTRLSTVASREFLARQENDKVHNGLIAKLKPSWGQATQPPLMFQPTNVVDHVVLLRP
jgi:hypothetical protein